MSQETFPFTYKDGPLAGFECVSLRCLPEAIHAPAVLHWVRKKPKGSAVFAAAQGLYALTRDEDGKVWASHVPSDEDRQFSDPPDAPEESTAAEAKPKKERKKITPEQLDALRARMKKLYGR